MNLPAAESLGALRARLSRVEHRVADPAPLGAAAVDARLGGGIARASLHELFADAEEDAAAATGFALMLALQMAAMERTLLWLRDDAAVRRGGRIEAMGLVDLGIDPARVLLTRAADAKGLLKAAIRDDDPVLFIETLGLLPVRCDVPLGEDFVLPIGVADVKRAGSDVTVVAIGRQVDRSLQAAERLESEDGLSVEVVDARTLSPLDAETITESVRRTGRLVVAQEATSPYSFAAEVCAVAAERCLSELKAPPVRVTSPFINVPTPVPLAEARAPGADEILAGVRKTLE